MRSRRHPARSLQNFHVFRHPPGTCTQLGRNNNILLALDRVDHISEPSGMLGMLNMHRTALQSARFAAAEPPEPARPAQSIESIKLVRGVCVCVCPRQRPAAAAKILPGGLSRGRMACYTIASGCNTIDYDQLRSYCMVSQHGGPRKSGFYGNPENPSYP